MLTAPRVNTKNTHGTGDTISACITAEIAKGHSMEQAIMIGKTYVERRLARVLMLVMVMGHLITGLKLKETI